MIHNDPKLAPEPWFACLLFGGFVVGALLILSVIAGVVLFLTKVL